MEKNWHMAEIRKLTMHNETSESYHTLNEGNRIKGYSFSIQGISHLLACSVHWNQTQEDLASIREPSDAERRHIAEDYNWHICRYICWHICIGRHACMEDIPVNRWLDLCILWVHCGPISCWTRPEPLQMWSTRENVVVRDIIVITRKMKTDSCSQRKQMWENFKRNHVSRL